MKFFINKSIDL